MKDTKISPLSLSQIFERHPLFHVSLSLMVGIVLGYNMSPFLLDSLEFLLLGSCFVWFALLILSKKNQNFNYSKPIFLFLFHVAIWLIGAFLIGIHLKSVNCEWSNDTEIFKCRLIENPKVTAKTFQVTAKILSGEHVNRQVRVGLLKDSSDQLQVGDEVLCCAKISKPQNSGNPYEFDYRHWLANQGISGVAFCSRENWKILESVPSGMLPLHISALRLRNDLVDSYEKYFAGYDLGVLSAMTLGDKSSLDQDALEMFSVGGVSHVLALSGLHLGILFGFFQMLVLRHLRNRLLFVVGSLVALVGIWIFTFLSGLPLSLLRSAIMFSVMQLMACLRYDSLSINNLSLAAILLLLWSPASIFDVGFQLSFLSVFSILVLLPCFKIPVWIAERHWCKNIYEMLLVSFCAQLGTMPLVAYYFHTVPVYGLLVNLFVIPLANLILILALLFFVLPFVQGWVALLLDWTLGTMKEVLDFFINLPYASICCYPTKMETFGCYAVIACVFYMFFFSRRRLFHHWMLLCLIVAFLFIGVFFRPSLSPTLYIYNLRGENAVHAVLSSERSYMFTTANKISDSVFYYIRRDFWKRKDLADPIVCDSFYKDDFVFRVGPLFNVAGKRIVMCGKHDWVQKPETPLPIDILYVQGDCPVSSDLSLFFQPKLVVLDAHLSDMLRQKIYRQSENLGWNLYDIRESGALEMPL